MYLEFIMAEDSELAGGKEHVYITEDTNWHTCMHMYMHAVAASYVCSYRSRRLQTSLFFFL